MQGGGVILRMRHLLLAFLALTAAPTVAEAPHLEQWGEPISIGRSFTLPSAALGEERRINVWLPPSYGKTDARYPVIYLIDGGLEQDFHHISGLAQLGAISWLTQEMIVVGVETVDRRRELAFPVERELGLREEFPTAGEAGLFRRYLVEEVKPFIAERYRLSGEDALLGESLAGLFIVETYLRRPEAFDTYIAMDPSLWWDDGRLGDEAPALLAGHGAERKRLWLSLGSETLEQPRFADPLIATLKAQPAEELEFRNEPRPNLSHATIYHPTAWEALQAFYPRPDDE
jgi:predicted alpha/beta superfamily hydrolase